MVYYSRVVQGESLTLRQRQEERRRRRRREGRKGERGIYVPTGKRKREISVEGGGRPALGKIRRDPDRLFSISEETKTDFVCSTLDSGESNLERPTVFEKCQGRDRRRKR